MKHKLFFLTLLVGILFSSTHVLAASYEDVLILKGMVGDTISFSSKSKFWYVRLNDIHYAVPDTIWIKTIKDKSKARYGKHFRTHQNIVSHEDIVGKQFCVMDVEEQKKEYSYNDYRINIYLFDVDSRKPIIWTYDENEDSDLMIIPQKLNRKTYSPNDDVYYYNNYKYTKDDYRGYIKVKCKDYISYYQGTYCLRENMLITVVEESGKEHSCSDKYLVITKDAYENLKSKTIQKLRTEGIYTFALSKIEKPKNPAIRYGKFQEVKTEDVISKYLYEDNVISIVWYGTKEEFIFLLKNKSDNSLKIVWDEASFINEENGASRIAHKGVSKARLNEMQPSTVVPKGTELNDMIVPVDRIDNFLVDLIGKHDPKRDGKNVKILLPIEIKGVINEYIFTFDLVWKYKYPELQ